MMMPATNVAMGLLVAAIIALSVAPFLKQNYIGSEQSRTPGATVSKTMPAGQGSN